MKHTNPLANKRLSAKKAAPKKVVETKRHARASVAALQSNTKSDGEETNIFKIASKSNPVEPTKTSRKKGPSRQERERVAREEHQKADRLARASRSNSIKKKKGSIGKNNKRKGKGRGTGEKIRRLSNSRRTASIPNVLNGISSQPTGEETGTGETQGKGEIEETPGKTKQKPAHQRNGTDMYGSVERATMSDFGPPTSSPPPAAVSAAATTVAAAATPVAPEADVEAEKHISLPANSEDDEKRKAMIAMGLDPSMTATTNTTSAEHIHMSSSAYDKLKRRSLKAMKASAPPPPLPQSSTAAHNNEDEAKRQAMIAMGLDLSMAASSATPLQSPKKTKTMAASSPKTSRKARMRRLSQIARKNKGKIQSDATAKDRRASISMGQAARGTVTLQKEVTNTTTLGGYRSVNILLSQLEAMTHGDWMEKHFQKVPPPPSSPPTTVERDEDNVGSGADGVVDDDDESEEEKEDEDLSSHIILAEQMKKKSEEEQAFRNAGAAQPKKKKGCVIL